MSMPLNDAGPAAAGCSLPQGPHTAVLDQRQVTDPDASDLQAFMSRQDTSAPSHVSPCETTVWGCCSHVS